MQFSLLGQAGDPPTNGTAVLKAESDGSFVPTGQTANFNITALSCTLVLTLQNGQVVNIPLPPDGAGVKETFGLNGDATYTCQGNTVTFRFPALTISLGTRVTFWVLRLDRRELHRHVLDALLTE